MNVCPPLSAVMNLRTCTVFLLVVCTTACEAVGTIGLAQENAAGDSESSTSGVSIEDANVESSSSDDGVAESDAMPATTDRGTTESSSTDGGEGDTTGNGGVPPTTGGGTDTVGEDVGTCCEANDVPGCDDAQVQECVCALDPYCCEQAWDEACVNTTKASGCSSCGVETFGREGCCTASDEPGCTEPEVQDCVCAIDPFCCAETWDQLCVDQVDTLGCGTCVMPPA
jgi:hypothetical protein